MGLDTVEFIMATEVAFGIDISDADAASIATPRQLITHLRSRLPAATDAPCLTQRAFYHVRESVVAQAGFPRAAVGPSTTLESVLPGVTHRKAWRAWGEALGAESWVALPRSGWFTDRANKSPATLGDVARHLAVWAPAAAKRGAGWTDSEIERGVVALIEAELGVDMARYTLDSRFVDDMGID